MKLRIAHFLLAAFLLSLIGCSKEVSLENGTGKGPAAVNFYATIDGKRWDADSTQLVVVDATSVSITGLSKTGAQMMLVVPQLKVGNYNISITSDAYALYVNVLEANPTFFYSNSAVTGGVISITVVDTVNRLVSGTFQFSLIDPSNSSSKIVTAGVFNNLPYTGDSGPIVVPPVAGADTLLATIDGVPFFATVIQVVPSVATSQLLIGGIAANGTQAISLLVPANISSGTYSLDYATGKYVGFYYPNPSVPLASVANGTLIIISNNTTIKRIKGTFSFNASAPPTLPSTQTAAITNGYFSVKY